MMVEDQSSWGELSGNELGFVFLMKEEGGGQQQQRFESACGQWVSVMSWNVFFVKVGGKRRGREVVRAAVEG
jgi:hypothetical protein